MDRRQILSGAGLAALAGPRALAQVPPPSEAVEQRLLAAARENLHPIDFDRRQFSGPGWEWLVREGRASEFVLLGEEHGTAEIPVLAGQLFAALRPAGFDTLAIEISPPIAQDLDAAARGGVAGIARFVAAWPPGPAFYFWQTEAELIAQVRASAPADQEALWGLDYEVTGDRRLIERLKRKAPPPARPALARLDQASLAAWAAWRQTHNPGVLFTFAGDPALVRAVREAWLHPDADTDLILATLEETLEINALFQAKTWESNERRARFNRANLVAHFKRAAVRGRTPKVMFKMGESHMMRGPNWTGNFDVGSLVHEAAELRGGKAFSFLVGGGGPKALHGEINPTNMTVNDAPVDMFDELGLKFLIDGVGATTPTLIDLRPLWPLLSGAKRMKAFNNPDAVKTILSFDALVFLPGTTGATMLAPGNVA